jgi:hypothetical protein
MQKITIPQLEQSRQRAALTRNSSPPTDQGTTTKYLPAARRDPETEAARCNQTTSQPATPTPDKRHGAFRGGLSRESTGPTSPSPESQGSQSFSSPQSSDRDMRQRQTPSPGRKGCGSGDGVEVWHGQRKGGNRAPKVEPEGTKTWRRRGNSKERETKDLSPLSSPPSLSAPALSPPSLSSVFPPGIQFATKEDRDLDLDLSHLREEFDKMWNAYKASPCPCLPPLPSQTNDTSNSQIP